MEVHELVVTPFQQNCRIIVEPSQATAVVIDPGGEVDRIMEVLRDARVKVEGIWLTHAHIDHAGGVAQLEAKLSAVQNNKPLLLAHRAEEKMRASLAGQAEMFGLSKQEYQNVREPDEYLEDGDILVLGELKARVMFTPGHSPGHVVFYFENENDDTEPVLIAGDTLFAGSIGRTDLPGGDYQTLMRSLEEKILCLPDETFVLSGHGPNTTIGEEKADNPFLTQLFE